MKPEVPERIWASTGLYYDYVQDWSEGSWGLEGLGVEYIRADHVDTLLKAEREKALHEAAEVCFAEKWKPKCSTDWVLARVKGHILDLIEKDKADG